MCHDSKAKTDSPLRLDISYIDPKLPRPTYGHAFRHWGISAVIYGAVVLLFRISPWFSGLLSVRLGSYTAWDLYCYGYGAYLTVAGFIFIIGRPRSLWASKNLRIAGYLKQLAQWCFKPAARQGQNSWRPSYEQKQAMVFLLVKIFYGPLMISYVVQGYNEILPLIRQFQSHHAMLDYFNTGYLLLVSIVFLLDVMMFSVGYHTESGLLKNKLRFVETNPLHILVCIACYPPFNRTTVAFFGPSNHDSAILFHNDIMHPMTWVMRGFAAIFLLLLVCSSLSLFTKASNLTNRGIVTYGPYRFVRHPGYLAKNLFWIVTIIPFLINAADHSEFTWPSYLLFCATVVAGFVGWGTIYFFRAITEERFLMRDPEYVEYCKKVKYRFIPGVY